MYKIQPIRVPYQKPLNFKFCAPFKIDIQKWEGPSFRKPVFDFSVLYPNKSGLSRKLKVSTIKGLKVNHSKVPSSGVPNYSFQIPISLPLEI